MIVRVFAMAACFAATPALAGAFMQAPEQGQVIAQLSFAEAGRSYDAYGRPVAIPAWRKLELSTYGEYGLADWLTVIGQPSWFNFHASPPKYVLPPQTARNIERLGATMAGARVRVYEWGDNILSVQAVARYSAGGPDALNFVEMGRRLQADLRLLFGRRIELMGMPGYVDVQAAFRTDGPFGNQARVDMTIALKPFARTTLMLQSFTAVTPGPLGARFAMSQKAQASMLFDVTDTLAVQLGALVALRGVNCGAERGLVSGAWWRF